MRTASTTVRDNSPARSGRGRARRTASCRRTSLDIVRAGDALVLDAGAEGMLGGTGVALPWNADGADAASRGPRHDTPLVLAGGLTPENVARGDRRTVARRRRRFVRRRARARNQGSHPHARLSRRGLARFDSHMTTFSSPASGTASARSAAATSPKRSSPRSTSWSARTTRRGATRHSAPSSTKCSTNYVGRPSALSDAPRFSEHVGAPVWLKREDLNHTGAHKINNTVGQVLLARRMGKRRIIAETGAGQHGVATATVCARFGLECIVYMGEEDMRRQSLNVFRMRLMGAKVVGVTSGTRTLKDATSEAIRDWVTNVNDTYYIIGSVVGPAPYPRMVRDFQSIIGREARAQMLERAGRLPNTVVACVGGGSNAMGVFHAFVDDPDVELVGVEAAGEGLDSGRHSASLTRGTPGVLHGSFSYLLQDENGQVHPAHSISAGLDYPGVGPEHSFLKDSGPRRVRGRDRPRRAGRVSAAEPARGHHSGARDGARGELDRVAARAVVEG